MRALLLTIVLVLLIIPAVAVSLVLLDHDDSWMKPVEARYVCMMNDKAFDREQTAIEIDSKTYYGCCPLCRNMLKSDISKRTATDPESGKLVDKAIAVIGTDDRGLIYYFENEYNFQKYARSPKPESGKGHFFHLPDTLSSPGI